VGVDLDYVAKGTVCLENIGNVIDSLLRLSLNVSANQFSGDRVDGTPVWSQRGNPGTRD
jgi:hypothetical protein